MKPNKKNIKQMLKKDYGNAENNSAYRDYDSRKRMMKFNRFFADYKVFTAFYAAVSAIALVAITAIINKIQNFDISSISPGQTPAPEENTIGIFQTITGNGIIYATFIILLAAGYVKFAYNVRVSFGNINVGQKGTARKTTREEIEEQYRKIPERDLPFPGMGGVPIARDESSIYIDSTNVNTLLIGGSRSGKGQIEIEPMIENISRAETKNSMVITDPKMELANKFVPLLKERGYETYILNLVDPEYSIGYNPLRLIIDEYKEGDTDAAEQLCLALGNNICPTQEGEKDPYWTDQARNVFVASVMAEIEDNLRKDAEENKRWKHQHDKKESEREEQYYRNLYGEDYELYAIKKYIDNLSAIENGLNDDALREEIKAAIENDILPLPIPADEISSELVRRSKQLEYKKSSFSRKKYYPTTVNEDKINIYSIVKMCNTLGGVPTGNNRTALDDYFDKRPESNFARITYGAIMSAAETTKGTIMSTFKNKCANFNFGSIAKMTAESSFDFISLGFGQKPIAVFITLPDYDRSNWFIGTVFIDQMYFILSKLATAMPGGALYRRVNFILDEFGNLPPLTDFSNTVTVCLGRNMTFTLAIQSTAQLENNYDKNAKTIKGNCGNQIYIMSGDEETTKEVSSSLGNETITTVNRTGKKLSASKELTEMSDERPLLSYDELMRLKMGETVVLRFMYRQAEGTKKGERIMATPILNMGRHRMHYAYEFLSDLLPRNQILYQSPNLYRILRENPDLKDIEFKLAKASLHKTDHINLEARSRSMEAYLAEMAWLKSAFECAPGLTGEALVRMNRVFDLLNLDRDERELYMMAGAADEYGEPMHEEYVLTNESIVDYANMMLAMKNRRFQDIGFELLDTIMPLPPKPTTEEELRDNAIFEYEVIEKMKEAEQWKH